MLRYDKFGVMFDVRVDLAVYGSLWQFMAYLWHVLFCRVISIFVVTKIEINNTIVPHYGYYFLITSPDNLNQKIK